MGYFLINIYNFRHRIGKEGIELILKESIRINGKDSNDKDVYIDTTVQEKNITFSTDDKLAKKIIRRCRKIADRNGLELRQSYTLDKAIGQVEKVTERKPRNGICDRGYRGRSKVRDTLIHIPKSFTKALSTYRKNKERKYFRKRAGIEPVIGHL